MFHNSRWLQRRLRVCLQTLHYPSDADELEQIPLGIFGGSFAKEAPRTECAQDAQKDSGTLQHAACQVVQPPRATIGTVCSGQTDQSRQIKI